jgi:fumarate reductase subunit D
VRRRLRSVYGAGPVHLVVVAMALVVTAGAVWVMGVAELWNSSTWWQSIVVWFVGAALVHDLIVFPLYAAADRLLGAVTRRARARREGDPRVSVINYVRVPLAACALLFVVFFPGILSQGSDTYQAATGQTQEPFLERFLVLSAAISLLSAVAYAIRRLRQSVRWQRVSRG